MTESNTNKKMQSIATEEFFYFFLRMRKGEVRRIVQILQEQYPDENPEQLAKRLIASKARLAMLGGTLLNLPLFIPGVGQALKLAGVVGATSMLTRMNLYLIMEIAVVFGIDISDRARVPEMASVVAASGLGAAAPLLVGKFDLNPWYTLPVGAMSARTATRLVGNSAIALYKRKSVTTEEESAPVAAPATAVAA